MRDMEETILCPNICTVLSIVVKNVKYKLGWVKYRIVGSIGTTVQCTNRDNANNTKKRKIHYAYNCEEIWFLNA